MGTGRDGEGLVRDLDAVHALDATARSMDELDAIRRRVVNVVGHALRTPVTTIAGMAAALATTDDAATRTLLIDGLSRNAGRVEGLLDDLLLAAGVSTALPVGDARRTSVRATFEAEWNALGGLGALVFNGDDRTALVRPSAFDRITHVVLDNALKYGHGPISVTSGVTSTGVRIEVESVGDVPNDEELQRAFELLYRGEHAVMAAPGLGIGLPVARQLARAENGDVRLERRGQAIVAIVELPV